MPLFAMVEEAVVRMAALAALSAKAMVVLSLLALAIWQWVYLIGILALPQTYGLLGA